MKDENTPIVQYWLDEIEDARKREKDFRDNGEEIQKIYNGEEPDKIPFNILFSNTETLLPALYSNNPRPVVKPKFRNKQQDKTALAASKAAERMLEYLIDNNMQGYEKFGKVMKSAALDGLLPGRGDISVKYEYEGDEGNPDWEYACLEVNKWNRVFYGHALSYSDAPWKAYELFLDKDEAKRLFKGKVKDLSFTEGEKSDDENDDDNENLGARKTACVYQIWDRNKKEVIYISPDYPKGPLKTQKDPLQLTGFFNSPPPLSFIHKSNSIIPTAPYTLYENQAKELNEVTRRIQKVTQAIKVRGAYNGRYSEDMEKIFDGDDNELVPSGEAASLMDGGFDKNIWLIPFDKLIAVLQTLIQVREQIKAVIYEITGISDIIRGQSRASETLGAQKIKEAWGSMRIKPMQTDVQEFARDSLRMLIDIAANKFSDQSWIKMTGLPYLTDEQFASAQRDLEMEKQRAQQMQMQAQAQGQQVPPPPPTPRAQMAMDALQQPKWSDILEVIRDDFVRSYLIDIETNSTLDVEATEDKKNISEFMNSLAQFMNGIAPMVKEGIMPFDAMKSMLLAVTQNYRFGREVEEEIKKMKEPKQQGPDPKEIQKQMQEIEKKKQNFEESAKQASDKLDDEFMRLNQEKQKFDMERQLYDKEREFNNKLDEMSLQMDQKEAENSIKDLIYTNKREIQSMMDKQTSNISKILSEFEKKEKEIEKESELTEGME